MPGSDIATHAILAFTAWAIVWYSLETRRLADVTEQQLRMSLQPIMIVTENMPVPRLLNIGKSPAVHVTLEDVKRGNYTFKLKGWELCLAQAQDYGLRIEVYDVSDRQETESGTIDRIKSEHLSCRDKDDFYFLFIHYTDIVGGKWKTICKVTSEGIRFEKVEVIK